jgi:hypothetical protein
MIMRPQYCVHVFFAKFEIDPSAWLVQFITRLAQ